MEKQKMLEIRDKILKEMKGVSLKDVEDILYEVKKEAKDKALI
jgi:nicotinamide mononucleotide (NMN) deamidase PncC